MLGPCLSSIQSRLGVLRRIDWRPLVIAAWGLVLLWPVRQTGWLCDDLFNASLRGLWIHERISCLGNALTEMAGYAKLGRINPGMHLWINLVFDLFPDLYWYKWAQVAAVLASLLVFYGCLRGMGADADLAALACLLASGLIQFRAGGDPVLAFDFLLPLLLILSALSVWLLHRHRVAGGRWALAGSLLLYAAAALTYEMTYTFWLMHAWVLFRTRAGWKRGALALLPFAAIPMLLTLGSAYQRSRVVWPDGSYDVKYSVPKMADTFSKQMVASLPCSYAGLDAEAPVHGVFGWGTFRHYAIASVLALLLIGVFAYRLLHRARQGGLDLAWWAALGLMLTVLPVPVLCFCDKYQGTFRYGFGWLVVFVQYFGVGLLLAAGVGALGFWLRRCPAWLLAPAPAVLFAAFTVVDYAANVQVAAAQRVPFLSPRAEIEEVIDAGVLGDVAPGGVLVIDRNFIWEYAEGATYFYCSHTHTRLDDVLAPAVDPGAIRKLLRNRSGDDPIPDAVRLRYSKVGESGGFVLAGRIGYARLDELGVIRDYGLDGPHLAVWRGEKWDPLRDRPFIFHSSCRSEPVALASEGMRRVRTTEHWVIYEIDSPSPYLEAEGAWLEFPSAAANARLADAAAGPVR